VNNIEFHVFLVSQLINAKTTEQIKQLISD